MPRRGWRDPPLQLATSLKGEKQRVFCVKHALKLRATAFDDKLMHVRMVEIGRNPLADTELSECQDSIGSLDHARLRKLSC